MLLLINHHVVHVLLQNTELSMLESDLPHMLATVDTLTDADIDALMNKLKHQLATREKKVSDETNRQIQVKIVYLVSNSSFSLCIYFFLIVLTS